MKNRRTEILERRKAVDELVKVASARIDPLACFPSFRHCTKHGLSIYLDFGRGDKLSSSLKQYIQTLLKRNMKGLLGRDWPVEEKLKRREMVAADARYIFLYGLPAEGSTETTDIFEGEKALHSNVKETAFVIGFVQYRFTVEEEIPVVYVYELQLEPHVQGKGLGTFLMQLLELIARENRMGAVVLTVQKTNSAAMSFYTSKLRYTISSISPSKVDPLLGSQKNYEILCKTFDQEAKTNLELTSL